MQTARAIPRGPVMLDIAGTDITHEDRSRLLHPATGGVILFAENFESVEQLKRLVRHIKAVRNPELVVAVDQEGGRVQRFRNGFTRLPAARAYGRAWDQSKPWGRDLSWLGGWVMASELRACGVDHSFAPILDVDQCDSAVIGNRAFHTTAEGVVELARAFIDGMAAGGMVATGKHFPGHGGTDVDSHLNLPIETRTLAELDECDLVPFRTLISEGRLAAIMTAHIRFEKIDPNPPTFSPRWLKQHLRKSLGFEGIIFSDDLHMEAAKVGRDSSAQARAAMAAGCDVPLICRDSKAADEILEAVLSDAGRTPVGIHRHHGDPIGALEGFVASAPMDQKALIKARSILERAALSIR